MRARWSSLLTPLALIVVALILAACGGGGTDRGPPDRAEDRNEGGANDRREERPECSLARPQISGQGER